MNKDAQQFFKLGSWRSVAEAQQWANEIQVDAADVMAMIDVAVARVPSSEAERHALRRGVLRVVLFRQPPPHDLVFRHAVRALKTAAPDARSFLVEVIGRLNSVQEHGELIDLLRQPDPEVRATAARLLIDVGSKAVLTLVPPLLMERGFLGFGEALEALVGVGGAQAVAVLERLVARPDAADRLLAIRAMGDPRIMGRHGPLATRVLYPLLKDPQEAVAIAAVAAIAQLASEADLHAVVVPLLDGKNHKLSIAVIEGLKRFPTARTAEVLERKLASGPQAVRLAVLSVLEQALADPSADVDALLGVVVSALGHPQITIRQRAGEVMGALSRSPHIEVGRTIVWLLRSGDVTTRRMAAEVLQSIEDPHGELWPKLLTSLRDDDWWVRETVMQALLELAGLGLSRYMVAWLQDRSDVVRRFALGVLARLKDPETIPAVVHVARTDSDWWAREKAIEVIAGFKDVRAIPILVDLMQQLPELQLACIEALRTIDPDRARVHVVPLLGSSDNDVRFRVLRFLEEHNDPTQKSLVEPLVNDPDLAVQRLARALLVRWRVVESTDQGDALVPPPLNSGVVDTDDRPLDQLLMRLFDAGGDDLLVAPERPLFMKRHGQIEPLSTHPLSTERVASLLTPLVTSQMAERLDHKRDVDFSLTVRGSGHRVRVNLYRQRGGLSAVFHAVRAQIPVLEELDLPKAVRDLLRVRTGLILVCGPTSSGKSTTLAAFIDAINRTQARHIISIEDPIEIVHQHKQALVQQRELGSHTMSYARALKSALREDPDVIVIGELRDRETIELALTAAETGHLVFGTVNATSSDAAVERLIHAVGRQQQDQARASLADSLRAVVCQALVRRRADLEGPRLLASELLLSNDAVANLIRKGKTLQLQSIMATSREQGMQVLDADLVRLVKTGLVDELDVLAKARNKAAVEQAIAERRGGKSLTPPLR